MNRVLFVCLGNICRSPTAEGVFRQLVDAQGARESFEIDSAGTIAAHSGDRADSRMRDHAKRRGVDLTSISRKVNKEDFHIFTHIIAMDLQNLSDLKAMAPENSTATLSLLLDHDPTAPVREVPDPYYGGAQGFETVLDLIESASRHLLNELS